MIRYLRFFLLAVKIKAIELSLFEGYNFGESEEQVSHLQFADDTLLMGKKSRSNIWAIKAALQLFELSSRLKINFHKSQLVGMNVNLDWLQSVAAVLNCKVGRVPFLYLRLPIGENPRRLSTWAPVVEKVRKRLSSWRSKSLSFGGRIVLLKSVLTALSNYFLSFFKAFKKYYL